MAQDEVSPLDSREAAERAAKLLGCKGAHQTSEGGWHPCESPEAMQTLLNEGIEAYRQLRDRLEKREGKSHRVVTWEDLLEELSERPNKRRRRFTRWEHLNEREPTLVGGPPGITSGPQLSKDGNPHKNTGIVAVLLPDETTAKPYLQKGGLSVDELHMTLGYFGSIQGAETINHSLLKESLVSWAWMISARQSSISGTVGGIARIGADDPQAVVLLVENPDFQKLRESLDQGGRANALDRKHPGFLPHMTLGYGTSLDVQPANPIVFDRIGIWWGEERVALPLLGKPA